MSKGFAAQSLPVLGGVYLGILYIGGLLSFCVKTAASAVLGAGCLAVGLLFCAGNSLVRLALGLDGEDQPPLTLRERTLRLNYLCCSVMVFSSLLLCRLWSLQGSEHDKWVQIASRQHETKVQVQSARGAVYDAAGRVLAASAPAGAIGVHPHLVADKIQAVRLLSSALSLGEQEVLEKLEDSRPFVWLARGVSRAAKDEVRALNMKGIAAFDEFRRIYPQGNVAGALLGRVNVDGAGLSGIELAYNEQLSAPAERRAVRRDARGRLVAAGIFDSEHGESGISLLKGMASEFFSEEPRLLLLENREDAALRNEGADLALSIDSFIQGIVEEEFARAANESKAKKVFGLLMNADTGQIVALAQAPVFDPNTDQEISPQDLRHASLQDSFEPGSTMKPLVAAVALDQALVRTSERMNCENGRYRVGRHTIRDVHGFGEADFSEVLVRSSNICMTKIGQRLGSKRLYEGLRSLGFGEKTGVELPGEAGGILRHVSRWRNIDVATHSFGQGVSVTALQLVRAYAVLANGGLLVKPSLLGAQSEAKGRSTRVFSKETADTISEILAGVTESSHGTGQNAKIAGVRVYGKTGTAQKARLNGRGYDTERVLASFIGYVNAREIGVPHSYVMLVAVDEPGVRPRWGGTLAAPVFRRAMERVLSHLMTQYGPPVQTASARREQTLG